MVFVHYRQVSAETRFSRLIRFEYIYDHNGVSKLAEISFFVFVKHFMQMIQQSM